MTRYQIFARTEPRGPAHDTATAAILWALEHVEPGTSWVWVPVTPRYELDNGSPGDPDLMETTLETFLAANDFDPETAAALRGLEVGATYQGDEGAGGTWSLRRLE